MFTMMMILSSHLCLGLSGCLLPSGLPTETIYAPPLSHTCQVPTQYYYSWFHHQNNTWWAVQIIKLIFMWFSSLSCYLVRPRPKHLSQHPILEHLQPMFSYVTETQYLFISVFNQLDAQNLFHNKFLFHASTCFEQMCLSSGGQNCIHSLWYHHTYRWPSRARVERGLWNKNLLWNKFCASSWLNTEINILRCTVSKTSKQYLCFIRVTAAQNY